MSKFAYVPGMDLATEIGYAFVRAQEAYLGTDACKEHDLRELEIAEITNVVDAFWEQDRMRAAAPEMYELLEAYAKQDETLGYRKAAEKTRALLARINGEDDDCS